MLLVTLLLVTACNPYTRLDQPDTYSAPGAADKAIIVGDSITSSMGAWDELENEILRTSYWLSSNSYAGWTIQDVQPVLDDAWSSPGYLPQATVVQIGTNDTAICVAIQCDLAAFEAQYRGLFDVVDASSCTIAVTIHHQPPGYAVVNETVFALEAEGTVDTVVDWAADVAANPHYIYDTIGHLTQEGQDAIAVAIVDAIEAC